MGYSAHVMTQDEERELRQSHRLAQAKLQTIRTSFPRRLRKTEERIRKQLRKSNASPEAKLLRLYECSEELFGFVDSFTPCSRGCSSCCHFSKIDVVGVEIRHIESALAIKSTRPLPDDIDRTGTPCPFLRNGVCSIYADRPYFCRRFISLAESSRWCECQLSEDIEHVLFSFTELDLAFFDLIENSGMGGAVDIRLAFPSGHPSAHRVGG
jgi:Fe-S-cluster containining protein